MCSIEMAVYVGMIWYDMVWSWSIFTISVLYHHYNDFDNAAAGDYDAENDFCDLAPFLGDVLVPGLPGDTPKTKHYIYG